MAKEKKGKEKIGEGSRKRILDFLLANKKRVLDWREIRKAAGDVEQWSRRMRELRDEYGYQILSHRDRTNLKPGQYLIETDKRRPAFARDISKETRAFVINRNGNTCRSCGAAAGDPDPFNPERTIRLTIGHIVDKSKGGSDDPDNLKALCTNCNEGLQNTALPTPELVHLLAMVRRASEDDARHVMEWLEQKFGVKREK